MRITFIQHSCFMIECDTCVLLFDWFDASRIDICQFQGCMPLLENKKKIYSFSSHKHQDHFDLKALNWRRDKELDITYILSKDIRLSNHYLEKNEIDPKIKEHIIFVRANENYCVDNLNIHTLKSTDAGVAFYVEVEGLSFYHAGDLNAWIFPETKDGISTIEMQKAYEQQISYLVDKTLTAAFVVLDPRQKECSFYGFSYFFEQVRANMIFPMHMWREYSYISHWKEYETRKQEQLTLHALFVEKKNSFCYKKNQLDQVKEITKENEIFDIELL